MMVNLCSNFCCPKAVDQCFKGNNVEGLGQMPRFRVFGLTVVLEGSGFAVVFSPSLTCAYPDGCAPARVNGVWVCTSCRRRKQSRSSRWRSALRGQGSGFKCRNRSNAKANLRWIFERDAMRW